MACKLEVENVLSNLKLWKKTDDGRDAITKDFKFSDFARRFEIDSKLALSRVERFSINLNEF